MRVGKHELLAWVTDLSGAPCTSFEDLKSGFVLYHLFEVLSGTPGYINLLDALNAWQLVRELSAPTALLSVVRSREPKGGLPAHGTHHPNLAPAFLRSHSHNIHTYRLPPLSPLLPLSST